MKHWTEPNGILLMQIPIEWQYLNAVIESAQEESPYSFELYEGAVGCFQLSCYPLAELAPKLEKKHPEGVPKAGWNYTRKDSNEFDIHLFFGAMDDQALIAKYIHDRNLRDDKKVIEQLGIVKNVLNTIVVVPAKDRIIAKNLDKHDRFLASLAASTDLLHTAIESESYIEIIIVCANQIDAFLRLSIVIAKQLQNETDEIDVRYLFQGEGEKGLIERGVFKHALELGVIDQSTYESLSELYYFRNRIVHRYIISPIRTRDMVPVVITYLDILEKVRIILRGFEDQQIGKSFGIYGRGFVRDDTPDEAEIRRVHSWANDKHLLERFKRKISKNEI